MRNRRETNCAGSPRECLTTVGRFAWDADQLLFVDH